MQLTASDQALWGVGTLIEVVLCVLIVRRGLYRRLPFFSGYLALILACGALNRWAYHKWGYSSWTAWYFAWITQGVALLARGLAVAELCWSSLRAYRGIWALAWRLLLGIAVLLLLSATVDARGSTRWIVGFMLTAERGLELAAAVILLSLLLISGYYRIRLEPAQRMIVLGLCFYSSVQVLNNSFVREWLTQYIPWWNGVHLVSFQVALVIWWLALRKPLPTVAPAPALLPQKVYDKFSPQVNYRLRVLNQRLLELLKS